MDSTDKRIALIRKLLCALSFIFLVAGFICTIIDYRNTTGRVQKLKEYEVIQAKDIEAYRNQKTLKYYVVTDVRVKGENVIDSMHVLDGEYVYIISKAQKYGKAIGDDGKETRMKWNSVYKKSVYTTSEVYTEISNHIVVNESSIYGIPLIDLETHGIKNGTGLIEGSYYYPSGSADQEIGNVRYNYYAIPQNAAVSAVVLAGKGKIEVQKIIPEQNIYYVYGNENDVWKYWEKQLVGHNLVFLVIGVVVSILLLFIAFLLSEQRKTEKNKYKRF